MQQFQETAMQQYSTVIEHLNDQAGYGVVSLIKLSQLLRPAKRAMHAVLSKYWIRGYKERLLGDRCRKLLCRQV
jgi:hypothetical protein